MYEKLKNKIRFMCNLYKIDYDNDFIDYVYKYVINNNIEFISCELIKRIKREIKKVG